MSINRTEKLKTNLVVTVELSQAPELIGDAEALVLGLEVEKVPPDRLRQLLGRRRVVEAVEVLDVGRLRQLEHGVVNVHAVPLLGDHEPHREESFAPDVDGRAVRR